MLDTSIIPSSEAIKKPPLQQVLKRSNRNLYLKNNKKMIAKLSLYYNILEATLSSFQKIITFH